MKQFKNSDLDNRRVACLVSGGPLSMFAYTLLAASSNVSYMAAYTFGNSMEHTKAIIEEGYNLAIHTRAAESSLSLSVVALIPELINSNIDTVIVGVGKDTPGSYDIVTNLKAMEGFIKKVTGHHVTFVFPVLSVNAQEIDEIFAADSLHKYRHLLNMNSVLGAPASVGTVFNGLPIYPIGMPFGLTEETIVEYATSYALPMPQYDGWVYDEEDQCIRRQNSDGLLEHIAYIQDAVMPYISCHTYVAEVEE